MGEDKRRYFEEHHDFDFAYEVAALNARFRANIFMVDKISAVFRIIPAEIWLLERLAYRDGA